MDKLRKIGTWVWLNVEKIFLVALIILLGFRVYKVFNPDKPEDWNPPMPPTPRNVNDEAARAAALEKITGQIEEFGPMVEAPFPFVEYPAKDLIKANMFSIHGSTERVSSGRTTPQKPDIKVTKIRPWRNDTYCAYVGVGNDRARRRVEGDEFGPDNVYSLQRIDADGGRIEVYSKESARTYEYRIE